MRKVSLVIQIARHLGPKWAWFRLGYESQKRLGLVSSRSKLQSWDAIPRLEISPEYRSWFSLPSTVGADALRASEQILAGTFTLFSHHACPVGFPPDWHTNPFNGERMPPGGHWSEMAAFAGGDIKAVWELNRFGWAFPLARAYASSKDPKYACAFWTLLENWMANNAPNSGAGWMCGQEATFRLMAASFAASICATADPDSRGLDQFRQLAYATGQRIFANLRYALSQSNNHGVSECVGLITAAKLLPSAPEAKPWLHVGLRSLKQQLSELVYADGAFSQHSLNYHRVLLDDLLWCSVVLRADGTELPEWLGNAARRALHFLDRLVSAETGRSFLYGPNDGAHLLPLSESEFLDYRPTLQAGYAIWKGQRRYPAGAWDEAAEWLGGKSWAKRLAQSPELAPWHAPEGGCLILPTGDIDLFLRCPRKFRHRPAQADLLHVGLSWKGMPLAIDPGTYSYNSRKRFSGSLAEAAVHNSVTFDGHEPLKKVSRFLYLPWPKGEADWESPSRVFRASHDGWKTLGISHVRTVQSENGAFRVVDRVQSKIVRRARWHWLFDDFEYQCDSAARRLRLATGHGIFEIQWSRLENATVSVVRADPHSDRGWSSPHYLQAKPALSLAIEADFSGSLEVETWFRAEKIR